MSFVTTLALAVGLFMVAAVVAHLLRRGRTERREFPPAALVSRMETHSRERSRLEDRGLLGLRMAMMAALAVLGATPLVQCSRLSVDRPGGASVALALVLDDSHSMRARTRDGEVRWDAAMEGARQLLRSVREGDAIALVLSGKPARLALSPTTDLRAARAALEQLHPSDRASDLDTAIALARSAIQGLQQPERRLIVLSDLAGARTGEVEFSAPLEQLRSEIDDCGLIAAHREGERVNVSYACSEGAQAPRQLRAVTSTPLEQVLADPERLSRLTLPAVHRVESLGLTLVPGAPDFELELEPGDDNPHNDRVPVSRSALALTIAVMADPSRAGVVTGGPTVIEQALGAVRPEAVIRPLALLPDETRELEQYAALVLNDPAGLSPESRAALTAWLERGGVALGLLGPASSAQKLSASLEPFAQRSARWEPSDVALAVDPSSLAWLGPEARELGKLTRTGRMRLEGAALPGSSVVATWSDGAPFLLQRSVGAGLVLTAGLPVNVDDSDFALRPAFLALLDHWLGEAERRGGPSVTPVGERWTFPSAERVEIIGPAGPLPVDAESCEPEAAGCIAGQPSTTPELAGRYEVVSDGTEHTRVARIDAREILDPPGQPPAPARAASASEGSGSVDASPELSLVLLGLFAAELALRLGGEARRRRAARALSGPT